MKDHGPKLKDVGAQSRTLPAVPGVRTAISELTEVVTELSSGVEDLGKNLDELLSEPDSPKPNAETRGGVCPLDQALLVQVSRLRVVRSQVDAINARLGL
jgi:hypothetical protein